MKELHSRNRTLFHSEPTTLLPSPYDARLYPPLLDFSPPRDLTLNGLAPHLVLVGQISHFVPWLSYFSSYKVNRYGSLLCFDP